MSDSLTNSTLTDQSNLGSEMNEVEDMCPGCAEDYEGIYCENCKRILRPGSDAIFQDPTTGTIYCGMTCYEANQASK